MNPKSNTPSFFFFFLSFFLLQLQGGPLQHPRNQGVQEQPIYISFFGQEQAAVTGGKRISLPRNEFPKETRIGCQSAEEIHNECKGPDPSRIFHGNIPEKERILKRKSYPRKRKKWEKSPVFAKKKSK